MDDVYKRGVTRGTIYRLLIITRNMPLSSGFYSIHVRLYIIIYTQNATVVRLLIKGFIFIYFFL